MKKLLTAAISGLLLCQAALAEVPAVYRDGMISVAGGAVIDADGTAYYRNIELLDTGDGSFRVVAAERAELADVESVTVVVDAQNQQADVVAEGWKSPCVDVLEPAVSRAGNEFIAVLPLSKPESEVCILMIEQFEFSFRLDIGELGPGTYAVVVNGVEAEFVIAG